MSLKAKLEAVIYAAEEPVTLTQLAALFAAEALEWKAEQETVAAATRGEASDPAPLLDEELDYLGLEQTPAVYASETVGGNAHSAEVAAPALIAEAIAPAEAALQADPVDVVAALEVSGEGPEDAEAGAKREAKQRDREVRAILRQLLDELIATHASDDHGVEIREIAGGYRMATKPECHDAVRLFIKSQKPPLKLSLPALETLAVIAYKQPVTAPEVNEIRGVESSGVLGSLLSRKLIATAGRKQVIGRPILYKTTKEFLMRFGLKDLSELPSMEEFEKMAAMELSEGPSEEEPAVTELPAGDEPELSESTLEEGEARAEESTTPDASASEEAAEASSATEPPSEEAAPAEPNAEEQAEIETPPHA